MSSRSTGTTPRRDQQTLFDVSTAYLIRQFPEGIILRYEHTEQFRAFLLGNPHITYVMINFSDALKIIEEHGSIRGVLAKWQVPIITATEQDGEIYERQRHKIRKVLDGSQPAMYVPDAGTVYWGDEKWKQKAGLRFFEQRLNWVHSYIEKHGLEIELLPLAKGMYRWHYEFLKDSYEQIEFAGYAFYTRQYVGGKRGNASRKMKNHIQMLIDVMDAENVFAIARHGPTDLKDFQPQVRGASGIKQFADNCKTADGHFDTRRFVDWRAEREDDLLNKTTVIQS